MPQKRQSDSLAPWCQLQDQLGISSSRESRRKVAQGLQDEGDDGGRGGGDGGGSSAGNSPGGGGVGGAYSSSAVMGAYDDGSASSAANAAARLASGRAAALDRGFGTASDRFAAPSLGGLGVPRGGAGRTKEEEDFGDADVGDLLKD